MSKTVLITGASSGIGRVTSEYFQIMGWNVAATMRSPEKEEELTQLENVKCFRLDVLDEQSISEAIANTISAFGQIDVVVNNAGYAAIGPFEAATQDQIKRQLDTNVIGAMNVIRNILPHFRKNKAGTIINISSVGGRVAWPVYSIYHTSKWALEGFSESLFFELRQFGIRVKVIEPGAIQTDFYSRSQDLFYKEGLTDYDEYMDLVMPNLQQVGAEAPGPEIVAEKIFKAANDKSWRIRYRVGRGAPFLLWMRGLIPSHWYIGRVRRLVERRKDRLAKYRNSAG
jgi:NAD(P)-dependent dehydrogenase (short-subunit alcohol dehydrogenase family)